MTTRRKVLLLATVPLVIIMTLLSLLMSYQFERLAERQLSVFKSSLYDLKDQELKDYVQLAQTAIAPLYNNPEISKANAQAQAQEILTSLTYSDHGYFFVYDFEGNSIVHPKQPYRVGKNWIDLKDTAGNPVIVDLIDLSKKGGGVYSYRWEDPSTQKDTEKRSYTIPLNNWEWFVGTGIYLTDIDQQILDQKTEFANETSQALLMNAALASAALVLVFGSIFYMNFQGLSQADQKLKELNHDLLSAQEDERGRVSRELHDSISQMLVSVKYKFEHANLLLSKMNSTNNFVDVSVVQKGIKTGLNKLLEATQEVRRISHALRPSQLDDLGLGPALENLCEDFSNNSGITTNLSAPRFKGSLPAKVKISLYRICQEALTNIEKHAQASNIKIVVTRGLADIKMQVVDDGVGLKHSRLGNRKSDLASSGLGFINMQERVDLNSGKMEIKSDHTGTEISIFMPVQYLDPK